MTDLPSLLSRVMEAEGPDQELDAAIWLLCFEPECKSFDVEFHTEYYDSYLSRTAIKCSLGLIWVDQMDPPLLQYTSSLEAALVLVRRVKPGWGWSITKKGDVSWACVNAPDAPYELVCGEHTHPAIALLAALIKLKMETEND